MSFLAFALPILSLSPWGACGCLAAGRAQPTAPGYFWSLLITEICPTKLSYKGRSQVQPPYLWIEGQTITRIGITLKWSILFSITCGNGKMRTKVTFYHWGLTAQSSGIRPSKFVLLLKERMRTWKGLSNSCPFHYSPLSPVSQHQLKLSALAFAPNPSLSLAFCRSSSCLDWQKTECHQCPEQVPRHNSCITPLLRRCQTVTQNIVRITNLVW